MSEQPEKAPRTVRIGKLSNLSEVAAEMARVYRDARRGEIESVDGSRLVYMLAGLRQVLEAVVLEDRISRLEDQLAGRTEPRPQFKVIGGGRSA